MGILKGCANVFAAYLNVNNFHTDMHAIVK